MRVWLARVFIGLAFCLLLAHNLFPHHHDEEAKEFGVDQHDHHKDHSATPFDNVKLDGDLIQKVDFDHTIVCIPIIVSFVEYNFSQFLEIITPEFGTRPPEYPPTKLDADTSTLRGPPVYC
ncbi:hypothetical protein [Pedobacter cryoconitis]|uniref:Uncharacterized protein n=1 Tax=Pedobacter cryoconitis TaxID=188932 RepID=A0A327SI28_9SPHI|nr:hypothetical protein [Pedobacter cryoconitis]RAJ28112.1 hypothetical protein LY11_03432 [Pedobacter cryoconitis]